MKYVAPVAILILLMSSLALAAVFIDEADASGVSTATMRIDGDDNTSTRDEAQFKMYFKEQTPYLDIDIDYTVTLYKDGKAVPDAVSSSTGSMDNDSTKTITVYEQSAGTYELRAVFVEKVTFEGDEDEQTIEHTVSKKFRFLDPIKLKVELKNSGKIDLTDAHVVFYLDGVKLEDSATNVSIEAGESDSVTYYYLPVDLSKGKHTYYLEATDGSIIDGIGKDHVSEFYYQQGDYNMLNWIGVIMLVVFVLLLAWVLTKPVKNLGKPKARKSRRL